MVVIKVVVMVLLIMALASVPLAFRTTNNHNTPRTWFSSLLAPPSSNLSFSLLSPLLPANSLDGICSVSVCASVYAVPRRCPQIQCQSYFTLGVHWLMMKWTESSQQSEIISEKRRKRRSTKKDEMELGEIETWQRGGG